MRKVLPQWSFHLPLNDQWSGVPSLAFASLQNLMIVGFIVACVLSLLLTRLVRDHARRFGLFDTPDARKVHREPIPRLGGIAIVAASALTVATLVVLSGAAGVGLNRPLFALLAGGVAMHLWGIVDDVHPMRARFKLAGQLGIATAAYAAGLRVHSLALPFAGAVHLSPAVSVGFTVVWLIALTNALNLIDGMDGLAGGVAVIALLAFGVIGFEFGRGGAAVLAITLAGATTGFLRYNFHPGTIFLGDSGSLFLGFMLAGLSLLSSQAPSGALVVAIPLVTLALPVLDTALTIVRRYLNGRGIFVPDRGHIHHRLLEHLDSTPKVSLILYAICGSLAAMAAVLTVHAELLLAMLVLTALGAAVLLQTLRILELEELSQAIRRGTQQRHVIWRSIRLREAARQLPAANAIQEVFEILEDAFSGDGTKQAEVRLRRDFVQNRLATVAIGRSDDELPIWTWSCDGGSPSNCWEIGLPLTSPDYERIGTLTIWEDAESGSGLSHLRVVRGHLSVELQRKLYALAGDGDENSAPARQSLAALVVVGGEAAGSSTGRAIDARRPSPTPSHVGSIPADIRSVGG